MIITLKEYQNGGRIDVYQMVNQNASDFKNIYACCDYFAKQGAKTIITPHFAETFTNPEYVLIYASLKGTPFWGKCPDFCVDGVWYEHEGYDISKDLSDPKKKADTFSQMIRRGVKQSNRIIVEDCEVGRNYARRTLYRRVQYQKQNIKDVYIRTDAGLEHVYKS